MKIFYLGLALFLSWSSLTSCNSFLDVKPDQSLAIPSTVRDLQSLLDHYQVLNYVDGRAAELSSTDYYLTEASYNSRSEIERRMYIWEKSNIFQPEINEWYYNYRAIYRANSVLEFSDNIKHLSSEVEMLRNIKGQAYFYRAKNYLNSLYVWAEAYHPENSKIDLGVPLRFGVDFNKPSVRASVSDGYNQVIADLKHAISFLPTTQKHVMRPSKAAAYGLLARTYWSMNLYDQAFSYADSCLMLSSNLLDFNNLNASANFPVPQFNIEILHDSFTPAPMLVNSVAKIDPHLVNLFDEDDLRRIIFLKNNGDGTYGFKGSYEGSSVLFSGVAVNEIYLIRAESSARNGNLNDALNDMNNLLINRYKRGKFLPIVILEQSELISYILKERRKELLMRGLRWVDVKRLNRLNANIELRRTLKGNDYVLKPNEKGFALPLPDDLIGLSGLIQNTY